MNETEYLREQIALLKKDFVALKAKLEPNSIKALPKSNEVITPQTSTPVLQNQSKANIKSAASLEGAIKRALDNKAKSDRKKDEASAVLKNSAPVKPKSAKKGNADYEFSFEKKGIKITRYLGEDKESITVPSTINGHTVASIGGYIQTNIYRSPFKRNLHRISLPDTLKKIDNHAFFNCLNLTEIDIPDSVDSIGNWAFYNCINLESINIPKSVKSIGAYAFYGCSNLSIVNLPKTIAKIESYTFTNCKNLVSITIPDFINSIGGYAFVGCSNLKSVTIPNNIVKIDSEAFEAHTELIRSSYIRNHKYSSNYSPTEPDWLRGDYTENNSSNSQETNTFRKNSNNFTQSPKESQPIHMIKPPDEEFKFTQDENGGVKIVKFLRSSRAEEGIIIPSTLYDFPVTSIGCKAFENIENQKIVIPKSVKTIEHGAFKATSALYVMFEGKHINLNEKSFLTRTIFYYRNSKILETLYDIVRKNNIIYSINYEASDFDEVEAEDLATWM